MALVLGVHVQFHECSLVEKQVYPLSCRQTAFLMLSFNGLWSSAGLDLPFDSFQFIY